MTCDQVELTGRPTGPDGAYACRIAEQSIQVMNEVADDGVYTQQLMGGIYVVNTNDV